MFEHFIKLLTNVGDRIVDPFMGSGSSAVAAKINNRNFTGIEIDFKYFEIARKRLEDV